MRWIMPAALVALGVLALSAPALAEPLPDFEPGDSATVEAVLDGGEIVLADGRHTRLAGIEVPHAATAHSRPWPYADRAKAMLEKLVLGRQVELRFAGSRHDRYGRTLAHVFIGRSWIQGELVRRGMARVVSTADNRRGVAELLAREDRARRARRGIWRDRFYAVRAAAETGGYANSFQIVEGSVVNTALIDGQLFVNFADDWRSAFSLRLAPETLRLFRAEGIHAADLAGERVRVRGWIRGGARPIIDITHPEQIERL